MFPKGTIYHVYTSSDHGEVFLHAPVKTRVLWGFLRGVGAGLIGFAVISLIFTFSPIVKEELGYLLRSQKEEVSSGFVNLVDLAEAERTVKVQEEAKEYGVGSYFSVVIPKIEAKSNVIANVDSANQKEYLSALEKGVAHARGTYFPGQGKNVYLFSHSTDAPWNVGRYNAVFYLLRKLEPGDKIIVFFADKKYEYQVSQKLTTSADDTSWLTSESQTEKLILQSCDPPGTTWRRLIVVAEPVDSLVK